METQPKESSNCQRLRAMGLCLKCRRKRLTRECPCHDALPDQLEAKEYRQRQKQGLCFKCREKGLAWQCPQHDQSHQQCPPRRVPFQGQPQGKVVVIKTTPQGNSTMQLTPTGTTQNQNNTPHKEGYKTQENSDSELEDRPIRKRPISKGKGGQTRSLSSC